MKRKPEAKASAGNLVIWRNRGERYYRTGVVTKCDRRNRVTDALVVLTQGWGELEVKGTRRVASAASFRDVPKLIRSAPLFETLGQVRDYFAPHRVTS